MFGVSKELKIHFIGIGGIGMSGIAEILLNLGYKVSGSDLSESQNVTKLKKQGAEIYIGHKAENINEVQIVVYSSAIDASNPEIQKAQQTKIPIIKRAEMLAELMRLKYGIAIAGSHGKTTTTSFVSTIFKKLDLKPTCIVGGIVKNLGSQAVNGDGEFLIAEADESDGSFLYLNPIMSVITNIDNDHLDYYKTTENIHNAFTEFSNKIPFYGKVALNGDDPASMEIINTIKRPYVTFGIENNNLDYQAIDINFDENGSSFTVVYDENKYAVRIALAGNHNVLNALAAIAISHECGLALVEVTKAIGTFEGVARRFETLHNKEDFIIVDDYGHHPTEIKATLKTAKQKYPQHEVHVIFEPHRYSRTKEHWDDFIQSFTDVDEVYISPIYAASEKPIEYIDSEILVKKINEHSNNAFYLPNWDNLEKMFNERRDSKVVLLSLGAGAISRVVRKKIESWASSQT